MKTTMMVWLTAAALARADEPGSGRVPGARTNKRPRWPLALLASVARADEPGSGRVPGARTNKRPCWPLALLASAARADEPGSGQVPGARTNKRPRWPLALLAGPARADEPGSGRVPSARSRASSDARCARTNKRPRWPLALLASAALVPVEAPAQSTSGVTPPQFQVDAFWPKPLPNNWILGQVAGIATDRQDRLWVVHRPRSLTPRERAAEQSPPEAKCCVAAPPVLLFDQSGNLVRHWGGPGAGYQWPESEHGIFVDDDDFVWLAGNGKTDGQLLKFTMDGKLVLQIGKQGAGNDSNSTERLGSPADVAVDVAGKEVFAADGYGNRRVVVFDSETGAYKRHWGAYGNKPSDEKTPPYDPAKPPSQQFGNPVHCIRLSQEGLLYVCDRTHNRLQIFRKDGTFVSEHVYEKATRGNGTVYDLVFSPDKAQAFIYMIDGMNGEVRIVDRGSKETLARFGRPGRQVGQFTALHNVAADRQGNVYTSEVQTGQRVQKFRRIDGQN